MKTLLAISGLHLTRGAHAILRGIDWQVRAGEHWVLLGPNGCGKTSLLRAITGYLPPTSGDLVLWDRTYGRADWRDLRRHVGLVASALAASIPPAEPAIETVVSGRYAQLDLWARPTRADLAAARRWLRFVGAAPLADREWQFLSQGERQRILIARALMARPRLLILDEPCTGLDPVARGEFLRFIDALARRRSGPTLLLVTHQVEEITPAFTHALLLRAGAVHAAGPKRRVLTADHLGAAFGARVALRTTRGRYRADFSPVSRRKFR
jgi:iron complex transport system ATP-binding protein